MGYKVAIITGGNVGIRKHTALGLEKKGIIIVILSRSYKRGKKTKNTNITVNTLRPGVVNTATGNKNNNIIVDFVWLLWRPFMISQQKGAQTSIYLASSKEVSNSFRKIFLINVK